MNNTIYGKSEKSAALNPARTNNAGTTENKDGKVSEANSVGHTSRENIELSANVKAEMEKASFDSAKVERIKESIRNGNYPIDLEKIAEGFVDLEKLL